MKKYPFNPTGKFGIIMATFITIFMTVGAIVFGYIQTSELFLGSSAFGMIFATCLIPGVLLLVLFIDYLIKDSGYFYIKNDDLILVKNRRELILKIEDIDIIKLKYQERYKSGRGSRGLKGNDIQFLIKMKDEKNTLPFFITNSMLYKILEPYNVRFRPKDFIEDIERDLNDNQGVILWFHK
ncbi:MAG: hypothetical protein II984_08215 [Clostridia bacterium]|nr:hypothetical protein [Clostridia bacterium]